MKLLEYFEKKKTDNLLLNLGNGYQIDMNVQEYEDYEADIFGDIWKGNEYIISCDDLGLWLNGNMSLKELKESALNLLKDLDKETTLYLEKEKDLDYHDSNEDLVQTIKDYLDWKYGSSCRYVDYTDNGYYCKVYVRGI